MRINCFVLIYDNLEIIKRSLATIMTKSEVMNIHVVENPSEYTQNFIKPIMQSLLSRGLIASYTLMDNNIRNNAIYTFLYEDPVNFWDADYVMLTDGDVTSSPAWLENQIEVLENYKDIFCCSVDMDTSDWSEGLKLRFPKPRKVSDDFIDIDSGVWLCLFRSNELKDTFDFLMSNKIALRDGPLIRFIREFHKMRWGVTPKAKARELTRSGYSTPDYTKKKNLGISKSGSNSSYWVHSDFSSFTTYVNGTAIHYAYDQLKISSMKFRPENESSSNDYLCERIDRGEIKVQSLYFGINIKNAVKGKSYLGNCDTLSFYHSNSNTLFIRCNIAKGIYPDITNCFDTIVVFDAFYNLDGAMLASAIDFCISSLSVNGYIRFSLPKDCPDFKMNQIKDAFHKNSIYEFTVRGFKEGVDYLKEESYNNRIIYEVSKKV